MASARRDLSSLILVGQPTEITRTSTRPPTANGFRAPCKERQLFSMALRYFAAVAARPSLCRFAAQHFHGGCYHQAREDGDVESSTTSSLSEAAFHDVADRTLDALTDVLDEIEDSSSSTGIASDEVDITCSQGVLTACLGEAAGTWVLNKQTPNRQIWWSSPLSGPKRFEWHDDTQADTPVVTNGRWLVTRGEPVELGSLLADEMLDAFGVELEFDPFDAETLGLGSGSRN